MTEAGIYHACDVEYEDERLENSGKYYLYQAGSMLCIRHQYMTQCCASGIYIVQYGSGLDFCPDVVHAI